MKTNSTSGNACLDLFFIGGACRTMSDNDIQTLFANAIAEDRNLTIQIMGYIRDIRGGMGERNIFRHFLNYCVDHGIAINISAIPELGRWDDVYSYMGTASNNEAVAQLIGRAIKEKNGLCAKWVPRKGLVNFILCRELGLTPKELRKTIVRLTDVVETKMCNNEWAGISYKGVPSMANVKYNAAFLRHDEERRRQFLANAASGKVKINSSASFPHDIVKLCLPDEGTIHLKEGSTLSSKIQRNMTALAMWNQLPNYLEGQSNLFIPVCDTSGSMRGLPMLISVALGLYISERNKGPFENAFITFTSKPYLQYTEGNLHERLSQIVAHHPASTNLIATFELILNTAIENDLAEELMPQQVLIISDMEFDQACRPNYTALNAIKKEYKAAGYSMPNIVFWNVNGRSGNVPVKFTDKNVALVSGASPAVLQAVLSGETMPINVMKKAVDKDRYRALIG